MVGKADIEMGLEDQMHALFSHSISHIGDDSRKQSAANEGTGKECNRFHKHPCSCRKRPVNRFGTNP
jgi:hypothetical protein